MTQPLPVWTPFSISEWHRLSDISYEFEPEMRAAFTRAVVSRRQVNELELRQVVTRILIRTCETSADVYGLVFNPNSGIYYQTIDRLVRTYANGITSKTAQDEVERLLPRDLSLVERRKRLDVFGLDARSAASIERARQEGASEFELKRLRDNAILNRGNMIATTETNRVVNGSLIALWMDNFGVVEKAARRPRPKVEYIGTSRRAIREAPNKTWVTRRDDKVCKYCAPLDGITARIDAEFDTKYGIFEAPPIHPRCRCFMILG